MSAARSSYRGGCHCGAIGYELQTSVPPEAWSIRACQCSFCRSHDALSTSDPTGHIEFRYREPQHLQRYRFGLKTADFLLCRVCGVYIGALIETAKGHYAIVNTHALLETPTNIAGVEPISYDGEQTAGRIERREQRWTPASEASVSD